jgi:hypothetical protein
MVDALDFRSPSREKVSQAGEITMKRHWETDELVEHWTLLPRETELLTNKTGATRLGFAVLLKFFQLEAYFPQQATDVPTVAVEFIAKQVKVTPEQFEQYQWRGRTIEYHRAQIRKLHGFRETTVEDAQALSHWLCEQVLPRESATPNASKAPSMTDAANCISSRPRRSVLTGWCVQRHGLTRKVSVLRFLRDYRRTIRRPWTPCCNRRLMRKTPSVKQNLKCRGRFGTP